MGRRVERLSDLAAKGKRGQENAKQQLADMAVILFQGLPRPLREFLWSQQGQIDTVQIFSAEPYFPWELLKLQGEEGEEGPFLCEAFSMTRWSPEVSHMVTALPLQNIAFVLAATEDLPNAEGEKKDLINLAGKQRVIEINPTFEEVTEALNTGAFDGWHFTGHGSARARDPNGAELLLFGDDFLTPANLASAKANFRQHAPLIFLNGCNTGRAGFSLTGIGGWAQQSLNAGAGAFIGTLWPVGDSKARAFSRSFYRNFLGGKPFGEAVRRARIDLRDQFPGDPAWLAYTVYGEPGALSAELPNSRILLRRRDAPVVPRSARATTSFILSADENSGQVEVDGSYQLYGSPLQTKLLIRRLLNDRYEIVRDDCTCVGIFFGTLFLGSYRSADSQRWGIVRGSLPRRDRLVLHFFNSGGDESTGDEIWISEEPREVINCSIRTDDAQYTHHSYLIGNREEDPLTIIGSGRGIFLPQTSYWRGAGIFDGRYYLGVYRYTPGVENWGWEARAKARWLDVWGRHEGHIKEKDILDVHGKDMIGINNWFRTDWVPQGSPIAPEPFQS